LKSFDYSSTFSLFLPTFTHRYTALSQKEVTFVNQKLLLFIAADGTYYQHLDLLLEIMYNINKEFHETGIGRILFMKTTLIECFEKTHIENIIASLVFKPDRLIFLCTNKVKDQDARRYARFLKSIGQSTTVITKRLPSGNVEAILNKLYDIITPEENYIFDITGGEELLIYSIGALRERLRDRTNINTVSFDIANCKMIDLDRKKIEDIPEYAYIDVDKYISLYGGSVINDTPQPDSEDRLSDISPVWELARKDPTKWNRTLAILKEFEKRSSTHSQSLWIDIDCSDASNITSYSSKKETLRSFLVTLAKLGIISDLYTGPDRIGYKYKKKFYKICFEKAGNALELKCFFEARELKHNSKPLFSSCYVGVNIDWDGITHEGAPVAETRNEIDLMLIHGATPIFISCKNGKIGEDELYKLNTVANRFGGKYSKKMLIASNFEKESKMSAKAYRQRARDMGITFIDNASTLTDEEWKAVFYNIIT